jgi:PST family polysaccharide transporter
MLDEIKSIYSRHHVLISNFNFMSVIQFSQIAFPLIIYPYLIRVLGKETYGIVTFSNAIITYLVILINFGFTISEVKEISQYREDVAKISEIVSSVLIIRTVLLLFSFLILLVLFLSIPRIAEYKWLYISYFGVLITGAIDPSFYFLGIERMKSITIINLLANTSFLILTFLFIRRSSQYILVPLFTSIGSVLGCIIGLFLLFNKNRVSFFFPKTEKLKSIFKESFPFFSARVSTVLIDKTNYILIGSFIGYAPVAYYDLAVKIVGALKVPFGIFNQVLFPNISRTKNINLVIRTLKGLLFFYVIGYFSLFFMGETIIRIIGGVNLLPSKYILYILGLTMLTELVSTFLGAPILLAMGYKKEFNRSIIFGSLFFISMVLILYIFGWLGLYQLTITSVCTGTFVLLYRLYYCKSLKLI